MGDRDRCRRTAVGRRRREWRGRRIAAAGDGRDGEIDPDLEVYAINVRGFGYGTGVGAALLATAAEIRLRR